MSVFQRLVRRQPLTIALAALLCGLVVLSASAQQKKPKRKKVNIIPAGPPALALPRDFTALRGDVRTNVFTQGAILNPEVRKKLDGCYRQYLDVFKLPENETKLYKVRLDLRQDLIMASRAPDVHKWLRDFLLAEMKKLTLDAKQRMAVRANALLMIGDLNQKEFQVQGLTVIAKAVPLPEAFDELMTLYQDTKVPSGLRAVALKGLHRHAGLGLPADKADELRGVMLKALADTNVPNDRSPAAHEWFRRRAVETLGFLGLPAKGGSEVLQAMLDALDDENASVAFRSEAACSIGRVNLAVAGKVNYALIAHRLGTLAIDITETQTDRDALSHYLECVSVGLGNPKAPGGVLAAATGNPDQAKFIQGLVDQLTELSGAMRKERDDSKLPALAQTHGKNIQQILQANPPQSEELKTP